MQRLTVSLTNHFVLAQLQKWINETILSIDWEMFAFGWITFTWHEVLFRWAVKLPAHFCVFERDVPRWEATVAQQHHFCGPLSQRQNWMQRRILKCCEVFMKQPFFSTLGQQVIMKTICVSFFCLLLDKIYSNFWWSFTFSLRFFPLWMKHRG